MTPSDPPTVTANPDKTLTGFTIGITAARRADEFAALLTRRGAEVIHAPAIRIIPLIDDDAVSYTHLTLPTNREV